MTPLATLLSQTSPRPASAAEAAGLLNAKTVRVENAELVSTRGLLQVLGPDALRTALSLLEQAGQADPLLRSFAQTIATTGISFADPVTQAMLDALGQAGWPAELVAALKAVGVRHVSPAEQVLGEGYVVTEQEAGAALAELDAPPQLDDTVLLSVNRKGGRTLLTCRTAGVTLAYNSSSGTPLDARGQALVAAVTAALGAYLEASNG